MTTIDPLSFAQDKWPYYRRGPFKIGSCQAWQSAPEEIQTCSASCALFLRETIIAQFTEQNELESLFGFSKHIKRLIQNHWWTKQQCQFLYNLIPSRHLLLATCCWGQICFTMMKFFVFTDGDMPGGQHSFCGLQVSVCAFVYMGFPPCVVLGPQCSPLWEITVCIITGQDAQESFASPLCTLSLEAYYII